MTAAMAGTLDEAYERLHATGPEFDGFLSNHGPMAAEAMVRHGHGDLVGSWLDGYMRRLEEFPRGVGPIGSGWQDALGDLRRVADWTALFGREIGEQPWRQVLNAWWPACCRAWWPPPRTGSSGSAIPSAPCWRTAMIPAILPSWPTGLPTGRRAGRRCPAGMPLRPPRPPRAGRRR
jgi:hypothetical protein